jgi:hypothetical protein
MLKLIFVIADAAVSADEVVIVNVADVGTPDKAADVADVVCFVRMFFHSGGGGAIADEDVFECIVAVVVYIVVLLLPLLVYSGKSVTEVRGER